MGTPQAPLPRRRPLGTREDVPETDHKYGKGVPLSPDLAERLATERAAALLAAAHLPKPGGARSRGTAVPDQGPCSD